MGLMQNNFPFLIKTILKRFTFTVELKEYIRSHLLLNY